MVQSERGHGGIRRHEGSDERRQRVARIALRFDRWFERVADRYPNGLRWAMKHRLLVVAGAVLSVVAAGISIRRLGFTWMPDVDGGEFSVGYRVAPGSNLAYQL